MILYPHQIESLAETENFNRVAIKGFEGLYEVDSAGRVFSIASDAHRRKRELKQYQNKNGYMKVNLYDKDGKCKKKYIHRLVAEAFIPNPESKPNINHIDCNVKNNRIENLEWCTQSENVRYQLAKARHSKAIQVIINGKHYNSEREASLDIFGNTWRLSYERRKRGDAECHV